MATRIKQWWPVLAICSFIVAVPIGGWAWLYRHPAVNQAQARAIQPVIDAYLHKDGAAQLEIGNLMGSGLKPQLFCDANIIEIRPDGPKWRVSMMTFCSEYARRGNTLRGCTRTPAPWPRRLVRPGARRAALAYVLEQRPR